MAHPQTKSIYSPRFDRRLNDEVVTRPARSGETHKPSSLPAALQDSIDWAPLRKVQPVNYMLPLSIAWLKALPKDVRPMALVSKYPRIANNIALEWDRPAACRAYLVDLLIDHRGTRKGFPADVHRDLLTLRDHYYAKGVLQLVE